MSKVIYKTKMTSGEGDMGFVYCDIPKSQDEESEDEESEAEIQEDLDRDYQERFIAVVKQGLEDIEAGRLIPHEDIDWSEDKS